MRYFSDENYFIKPVGRDDLPSLAEHRNSELTWNGLSDIFPKWQRQQVKWLKSMSETNMYFVVYEKGPKDDLFDMGVIHWPVRVGLIRITDVDYVNNNALVGLDVFEDERGQGHASKIMRLIQDYCFNYLNMHRLWLLVKEDNMPAIKAYRRTGFRLEGVMRQHLYRDGLYHDYLMMAILKDEWKNDNTSVSGVHG